MNDILLEKFCKNTLLPRIYNTIDLSSFGEKTTLYPYQQEALNHVMACLYIFFNNENLFYNKYEQYPEFVNIVDRLHIKKSEDNSSFSILEKHFPTANDILPFKDICNRASFWMATGSGKTLVMVKLIEILFELSKLPKEQGGIPPNDILILAPKDKILSQIKDQINFFNQKNGLQIDLYDLREWESIRRDRSTLFEENRISVFYYRSDNLKNEGSDTANETNYLNYMQGTDENGYTYGRWYVLLDEAHKGITGDSKRQNIYSVLAKNGFLFNFSATFTDAIDIATTVFNFNLEKFINSGYGKHIKVTQQEFKNFNSRQNEDFNDSERENIVLKSLIQLTAIKKCKQKIDLIKQGMYHNPLMITIANTVNTVGADLKIFFETLSKIAQRPIDISNSRNELIHEFREIKNRIFEFETTQISEQFIQIIGTITYQDILELVLNSTGSGKIEVIKTESKDELAFQMTTSNGRPFALLKASEVVSWEDNVLDGYFISQNIVKKSYFNELNDPSCSINILLGSRIFSEGWDSNRPNVINFINIGVGDAQKFVLQSIGRGVRIEPFTNQRNRLEFLPQKEDYFNMVSDLLSVLDYAQALETVYVFSTKKETISAILENIEKNSTKGDWKAVNGIKKNETLPELPTPEYEEVETVNPYPFSISKKDYAKVLEYLAETNERILIAESSINLSTILLLKNSRCFVDGKDSNLSPDRLLINIDKHFRTRPFKLKKFREVIDGEDGDINHYFKVKSLLNESELEELHKLINNYIEKKYESEEEIGELFRQGKLDLTQLVVEVELFRKSQERKSLRLPDVDRNFLQEHYYNPVLLLKNGDNLFQNIITEESEYTFFRNLAEYAKNTPGNNLEKYDWWYFSKLVQNVDQIKIPYFHSECGEYRNFYPDFIFWLKSKDNITIKFIDPKGLQLGQSNTRDKVVGFEKLFNPMPNINWRGINVKVELVLYNMFHHNDELLEKYRLWDLNGIF